MKRTILLLGASLLLTPAVVVTVAEAQQAAVPSEQFVTMAAVSNMFEIQSSMMAKSMADSADVKAFAEQMITDHTKAGEELKQAAGGRVPDTLDNKHQSMIDQLNNAHGAAFDKSYVDMQVNAHKEAVALFTSYSQSGDNDTLKAFAAKTLPVLQQHYGHIQQIAKKS
jgi:putative membrane protein